MNGAYVSSTPMPHIGQSFQLTCQTVIPVPVVDMRPFSNSMMLKFVFQIAKKGQVPGHGAVESCRGRSARTRTWTFATSRTGRLMPNLEIFSNAGYPFTRHGRSV